MEEILMALCWPSIFRPCKLDLEYPSLGDLHTIVITFYIAYKNSLNVYLFSSVNIQHQNYISAQIYRPSFNN